MFINLVILFKYKSNFWIFVIYMMWFIESIRIPLEPINPKNTVITNDIIQSNHVLTNQQPRPPCNTNQTYNTYNSSCIPSNAQIQSQNINWSQAPSNNHTDLQNSQYYNKTSSCDKNIHYTDQFNNIKHKSRPFTLRIDPDIEHETFKDLASVSEKQMQYNSLLQNNTTISFDGITDSHSLAGNYNWNQKSSLNQQSPYEQQKDVTLESPPQFKQAAIYQPHELYLPTNQSSLNQQSPFEQQKDVTLKSPLQSKQATNYQSHASNLPVNSHTKATQKFDNNSQGLYFPNESSLVNWLSIQPDLITQAQSLPTAAYFSPYKVCFVLYYLIIISLFMLKLKAV